MYAKVFSQIFDSSISSNYVVRHVFMDLLVLADKHGIVDMTHDAIARRTNIPMDILKPAIKELEKPDPNSRTPDEDGARITRLSGARDWGWSITNYEKYREMKCESDRNQYKAENKKKKRDEERKKAASTTKDAPDYHEYMDEAQSSSEAFRKVWLEWLAFRKTEKKVPLGETAAKKQLERLAAETIEDQIAMINQSIENSYQGIFELKTKRGCSRAKDAVARSEKEKSLEMQFADVGQKISVT